MRAKGWSAIEVAKLSGLKLSKYNDPVLEHARDNLTVEEAEDVAREDPSLIYVDIAFAGWRKGNDHGLTDEEKLGLQEEYYWKDGRFLGPDDDGIYPVYSYDD